MTRPFEPPGYAKYVAIATKFGQRPDGNLARFASRYVFAGQITGIDISGISDQSREIYLVALRISLAYSALEQLDAAIAPEQVVIRDLDICNKLRMPMSARFVQFLVDKSETKLANRLRNLLRGARNADLRPIVEAIRHLMFHGSFNPSAAGIRSKSALRLLLDIDRCVFRSMDNAFANYLGHFLTKNAGLPSATRGQSSSSIPNT